MKILIVNTYDIQGGAARAAYRLHNGLLEAGVDSNMLVQAKMSDDYTVLGPVTKFEKLAAKGRAFIDRLALLRYKNRKAVLFSQGKYGSSNLIKQINSLKPDVVHLHWVNEGFLSFVDIGKIKAPIAWTLHDDWVFTGGCHIKWGCDHYKTICGECPNLGSNKKNDLSRKVFERKRTAFRKVPNITFIGVSRWLTECAKQSVLLKNHQIVNLPNILNTQTYSPYDKNKARELFNLPSDKKLILFGAVNAVSDINKGFKELSEALLKIDSLDTELVVFGSSKPQTLPSFKQKAHYIGRLNDDVSLRALYSAADVMIVPSLQEAFGQTAIEAMACATPVVAFATSGLLDIVDHLVNGYLAKPFDNEDLAKGIEWLLKNEKYAELCLASREKILSNFDSKVVTSSYISLYTDIIRNND